MFSCCSTHESQTLLAKSPGSKLQLVVGTLALLIFGTLNNVGGSMMSLLMPEFPAFLLYFTTLLYTIVFWIIAFIVGERPFQSKYRTWPYQRHILKFAAAWVSGSMAQVLANFAVIQLPFFELKLFPERKAEYSWKHVAGLLVILAGICVGLVPAFRELGHTSNAEQSNTWYWVLLFLVSTTFTAWEQVAQDQAFHSTDIDMGLVSCLAWYNLYSLPVYLLAIGFECVRVLNGTLQSVSLADSFAMQWEAVKCFAGHPSGSIVMSGGCQHGATLWVILFALGYVGMFGVNALFINKWGVLFPNVLASMLSLTASLAFMLPSMVGAYANHFSWFPLAGCVVIMAGTVIKGLPPPKDKTPLPQYDSELGGIQNNK